jgi:hypothetical protein
VKRLRGAEESPDRRGRVGAAGRDAGEVPRHRHPPPEIRPFIAGSYTSRRCC